MLPTIVSSSEVYGTAENEDGLLNGVRIAGILGDQQVRGWVDLLYVIPSNMDIHAALICIVELTYNKYSSSDVGFVWLLFV